MKRAMHNHGFTLLELLIAMALLGFILALLFGGFRLASRSWDAVDARQGRTTEEEMARALMRRLLTQMQPLRWKKATNQALAFIGEPDRLVIVAPLSGQAGVSGLRVIELFTQQGTGDKTSSVQISLRQGPLRREDESFADSLAGVKGKLILDDLSAVQFDYFGPATNDAPPQWQSTWLNPSELPKLIRVRMGSPDPGWADIVVAPAQSNNCNWDAFYKRCR